MTFAIYRIFEVRFKYQWLILACFTALAGRFTVRLPGVNSKLSIADTFIFTNIILFGPEVGSITAALDGFLGSIRSNDSSRRYQYSVFNMTTMALSAYLAGRVLFFMLRQAPLYGVPSVSLREIILPVGLMALVHYFANSISVAIIAALEAQKNIYQVWRERFLWFSITYFMAGSAAALIVVKVPSLTPEALGVAAPILLVTYFTYKTYLDKVEGNAHHKQLDNLYLHTVEALAMAIDARESGTLGQAKRVQICARGLAVAIRVTDEKEVRGIESAALLLDIGNLAVPESILNNPGQLSHTEFRKVAIHPVVGANILSTIDFPYPVADYVRHHHERWDGSGYPDQLKGDRIPLGARILALADCYVALTCDRPYQAARSRARAMQIIRSRTGTYYDPALVEAFDRILDDLNVEIHEKEMQRSQGEGPKAGIPNAVAPRIASRAHSLDLVAFRDISVTQKEVSVLNQLTQALASTLNLPESLALLCAKIAEIVRFTTCVIYLHSESTGRLTSRYACGENAEALKDYSMELGENLSGWVAARKEPVINANARLDLAALEDRLTTPLENALVHPLVIKDSCLGTISLYVANGYKFDEDDLRVVATVSQKAAAAIRNMQRFEEAQEGALSDPLTSLPNTRYLRQYFERELSKAKSHGYPICALGMDLDGFKAINDGYGHKIGDQLLVEIANVLRSMLRGEDLLARQGGDEFVAVLNQTDRQHGLLLAQRIQKAVDDFRLEVCPGEFAQVGISVGCASYPEDGDTLALLLNKADLEMYRDKENRSGRTLIALQA